RHRNGPRLLTSGECRPLLVGEGFLLEAGRSWLHALHVDPRPFLGTVEDARHGDAGGVAQRDSALPMRERRAIVAPQDLDLRPWTLIPRPPERRLGRQGRREPFLAALRDGEAVEARSFVLGQPAAEQGGTDQDTSGLL